MHRLKKCITKQGVIISDNNRVLSVHGYLFIILFSYAITAIKSDQFVNTQDKSWISPLVNRDVMHDEIVVKLFKHIVAML